MTSTQTTASSRRTAALIPVLFTATIFLSASLLFFVQPLFAKIVLPAIGGAPAVWTTAMLFFQTVLIAGYLYAHLSTKYLPVTAQLGLHLALWALALMFLPLSIQTGWRFDPDAPVALQTLTLFAVGVGLPFAVLSANAPLIQSWYAKSDGPSADDPYFLYGASNFGSLTALLAFPLVAEPMFGAADIGWAWAAGFILLGAFLCLSGLAARRGHATGKARTYGEKPQLKLYGLWLFLAFVPSSLMLAVTSKISTDIGSFPLVWVLPLALYLLTFVLCFTNRPWIGRRHLDVLFLISLAMFAIVLTGIKLGTVTIPLTVVLLLAFFFIAMKAHQTLYDARPGPENLTVFYLVMSVGGALGGLFNAILAPSLFTDLHEARITVFLAAFLLLVGVARPTVRKLGFAVLTTVVVFAPVATYGTLNFGLRVDTLVMIVGVLMLVAIHFSRSDGIIAFAAVIAMIATGLQLASLGRPIFKDRSFFGAHLVEDQAGLRIYRNGTTLHGAQMIAELSGPDDPTPLFYYHPQGPMARVMTSATGLAATDIGVIGLGVGSLACYTQPGQSWQFYEIDTMVDRVARDPAFFTFISDCNPDAPTHIGDARVVLAQQTDTQYDILVVDAYSSDAVPVHLTTNEALKLYRDRLKPGGIIMFHITNRYYDLSRPLARSAADLGLSAYIQRYDGAPDVQSNSSSKVVIMSPDPASIAPFAADPKWDPVENDGGRIWTDDYANLLAILK
ncbi:spermidine synthase [Yoonia sp.]|uniref:spermidine synthase n=1 Tax=Yoonia sp. TaxID=2212373 RepID=UPI003F6D86B2